MAGRPIWRHILIGIILGCCGSASAATVHAAALRLPITLDYPLLTSIIIGQAYRDPGATARVLDLADGCNRIVLSHPRIGYDRRQVRLQTRISLSTGTPMGDYCVAPLDWEGEVVLWQQPRVGVDWRLRLIPVDSMLLDSEGQPAPLAGWVWDLVKTHVHSYLGAIRINLAPPVEELKAFLLPLFDVDHQNEARLFLESMRPGEVNTGSRALKVDILTQTPDPPRDDPSPQEGPSSADTPPPSPDELARVMALWETWDAVLVHMVLALAGEPLTLDDQQTLLDTLLAVRYEFSAQLASQRLSTAFVRSQFIEAWQQINPVFRHHLGDDPSKSVLGYLAFFTAADALAALDQVGPAMGIEISREGFMRLARLISDQPLRHLENPGTLNLPLREILGLGQPLETPRKEDEPQPAAAPPAGVEEPQSRGRPQKRDHSWALGFLGGRAWAGEGQAPKVSLRSLGRWTPEKGAGEAFVKRVVQVLERAVRESGPKKNFPRKRRKWFEAMVLATAWQESCFRQFQVQKGKIVYLLSYNNSSVGLMQINERVWSGIYDRHKLRWDINYNAAAGADILTLYLQRYILKQNTGALGGSKKARRHLAGWLYALYNGGPRQLKRYPQRQAAGKLYQSDQLLLEKYDQVTGRRHWMGQVDCLPPG